MSGIGRHAYFIATLIIGVTAGFLVFANFSRHQQPTDVQANPITTLQTDTVASTPGAPSTRVDSNKQYALPISGVSLVPDQAAFPKPNSREAIARQVIANRHLSKTGFDNPKMLIATDSEQYVIDTATAYAIDKDSFIHQSIRLSLQHPQQISLTRAPALLLLGESTYRELTILQWQSSETVIELELGQLAAGNYLIQVQQYGEAQSQFARYLIVVQ